MGGGVGGEGEGRGVGGEGEGGVGGEGEGRGVGGKGEGREGCDVCVCGGGVHTNPWGGWAGGEGDLLATSSPFLPLVGGPLVGGPEGGSVSGM